MPQKKQITREQIVTGALSLLRREGVDAMNARAIARHLGISTQPIYACFSGMGELMEAVGAEAYRYYLSMVEEQMRSGKYPHYKSYGMAYIRFAKEEGHLFRFLFLRDRSGEPVERSADDFDGETIRLIMENNGLDRAYAYRLQMHMWTFVHGIATMLVTSFYPWEDGEISQALTDAYEGVRARLIKEYKEKIHECN